MALGNILDRLLTELLGTQEVVARQLIAGALLNRAGGPTVVVAWDTWLVLGPIPDSGELPPHPLLVRTQRQELASDPYSHKQLDKRLTATMRQGLPAPLHELQNGFCLWNITQFGKLQFYTLTEDGWRNFGIERAVWPDIVFRSGGLKDQRHNLGSLLQGALLAGAR